MGPPVVGAVRMVTAASLPKEIVANVFLGERLRDGQDAAYEALGMTVTREFRPTKEYPKGQEVYSLTFEQDGSGPPRTRATRRHRRGHHPTRRTVTGRPREGPVPERAPLIKRVTSDHLRPDEVVTLREIFDVAWGDGEERFTDEDWEHALGGVHFVLEVDGDIAAHASVVERELHTNGLDLTTGYVEAVATRPTSSDVGTDRR